MENKNFGKTSDKISESTFSSTVSFENGKSFPKKSASKPEDYLEIADAAEKLIKSHAVETETEIFWSDSLLGKNLAEQESKNLSLGYGQAGILYLYLQLYSATGDKKYLPAILKSVEFISKRWKSSLPDKEKAVFPWPDGKNFGFYSGISGTGSVLALAYRTFKNTPAGGKAKSALEEIVDELSSRAQQKNGGITWAESITTLTDGGILLFLTSLYEILPSEKIKNLIEKSAVWYLSQGKTSANGGLEFSDYESVKLSEPEFKGKNVSQPNFELGSAGAGFVLARIYQVLKDEKYLEAAKKVAVYLDLIKIPQEKGFLLPYRVGENQETFFYLGNCHGAAGSGKFYFILYEITKEKKYLDCLNALFDGLESLGAPEKMSKGYWNNVSVCCGAAGILNTAAGIYASTGEKRWKNLAERSAEILLGNQNYPDLKSGRDFSESEKENRGKGWTIAYRRIAPSEFSHTIFYNDGDAGIAAALVQLYEIEKGGSNKNRLPDDPFKE